MHLRALFSILLGRTTADEVPVWALASGVAGCVLWGAAYLVVIITCFRQKTYGIPLAAICMNITWEILSVFFWVAVRHEPAFHYADIAWLGMDLVIISQLLLYGREQQRIGQIREYFYLVVAGTLILAFLGQYTFPMTYRDEDGFVLAFIINMGMSILFVFMFFARPDLRGLSYSVAWLKMLGTLCESIMCVAWMPAKHPEVTNFSFFYFLYITTFIFDCIYIGQLSAARREVLVPAVPATATQS
jgi:hypothetical protein